MVKLIKLDGRHNLYHKGYAWAFRFSGWSPEAAKIESEIRELEGRSWDNTFWGKTNGRYGTRPYYVGIRKESTGTMLMLKL